MSACEKCWSDSRLDAETGTDFDDGHTTAYSRLLAARKATPCTPEQQAGPDATECPKCHRMTKHQHTRECMACGDWPER